MDFIYSIRRMTPRHFFSKVNPKIWIAAIAASLLLGCASVAPGMHMSNNSSVPGDAQASLPTIKMITAQLLKYEREQREHQTNDDISRLIGTNVAAYMIGSGDILSIVVWDHPELAGAVMLGQPISTGQGAENAPPSLPPAGFAVDKNGLIQFPFAGALKVEGLTEEQARAILTAKLVRYINKPSITLRIQAYRSKRIYIDGEVKSPGLQAINDIPMTLTEALNRAGGLLPTADQSRLMINRADTSYHVDLLKLVQRGVNPANILLVHGDVVRVLSREESKVFVSGEVVAPKSLTMHNGRLTLNEALGESGGINPLTGDGRQVYVVRKSATEPVIYQLDASSPGALAMAEGFELAPKDVVYVAASPLTNWHRGISLLLPGPLSSVFGAAAIK